MKYGTTNTFKGTCRNPRAKRSTAKPKDIRYFAEKRWLINKSRNIARATA